MTAEELGTYKLHDEIFMDKLYFKEFGTLHYCFVFILFLCPGAG